MSQISKEMALEYERIQKRATEDPGTAGDQGEENWAELLKDWLPPAYQVVTKGRIINHEGKTSPQVDVLVLKPCYPKKLLNKKVYLAAGIAAAFECKVTLKSAHITEALENCVTIKSLFNLRKSTLFKEQNSPIIYGLLAHSHCWKGESSTPIKNLESKLIEDDSRLVDHPRKMIDLICVADLGTWGSFISTFLVSNQRLNLEHESVNSGRGLWTQTVYLGHTIEHNQEGYFSPVGSFFSRLFQKLSWESEEYRSLARYFAEIGLSGDGNGCIRYWDNSIYSDELKARLERIIEGVELVVLTDDGWNEWQMNFVP
jgi:hypothetical protein